MDSRGFPVLPPFVSRSVGVDVDAIHETRHPSSPVEGVSAIPSLDLQELQQRTHTAFGAVHSGLLSRTSHLQVFIPQCNIMTAPPSGSVEGLPFSFVNPQPSLAPPAPVSRILTLFEFSTPFRSVQRPCSPEMEEMNVHSNPNFDFSRPSTNFVEALERRAQEAALVQHSLRSVKRAFEETLEAEVEVDAGRASQELPTSKRVHGNQADLSDAMDVSDIDPSFNFWQLEQERLRLQGFRG